MNKYITLDHLSIIRNRFLCEMTSIYSGETNYTRQKHKVQTTAPKHIIISRSDNIGDVVLTLPLASAIKAAWPQCTISVLARKYVQDVVTAHPAVDNFLDWEQINKLEPHAATEAIKKSQADTILHVFPQPKIAKLAKAAGIKQRIGTNRRWYHWLYCNKLVNFSRRKSKLHEAQLNMLLLQGLNLNNEYSLEQLIPMVQLQPEPLDAIKQLIDPERFTLVLHPLSHGHGREWPVTHFASLSRTLDPKKYQVLVTGSAAEGQRLAKSELLQLANVKSLCGELSLKELLSLLNQSDGVIASGTGPLHIAAACGTITLGLFPKKSGIDIARWGPVGTKAKAITCLEPCLGCKSSADCACMRLLQMQQVLLITKGWLLQEFNKKPITTNKPRLQIEPQQVIPYFICNLPSSHQRKLFQKKQAYELGLELHVIPSINIHNERILAFKSLWEHSIVQAEYALLLSFLDTIEAALNSHAPLVMIAEDDTVFCQNFREELNKTISQLPTDWEIFHLGSNFIKNMSNTRVFKQWPQNNGRAIPAGQPVCFISTRKSLLKLHAAYKNYINNRTWRGLDIILTELYQANILAAYMANTPQLCLHEINIFGSDIGNSNSHLTKYAKLWRWQNKSGYKKIIAKYISTNFDNKNILKRSLAKFTMYIFNIRVK